jgi:thiamine-phosphate pyrophosphorylase
MSHHARLILITPLVPDPAALLPVLGEALAAGRVDAVILTLPDLDERGIVNYAKAFTGPVQKGGAALLLAGHPECIARAGADGVHIADPKQVAEALELLKPHERIVGCAGIRSRHEAMEIAERGCDYLMFGEPYPDGVLPARDSVVERAAWWAEVFQTPCVAYAPSLADVDPLAATMAEFVALGPWVFNAGASPSDIVRAALGVLEQHPLPVA